MSCGKKFVPPIISYLDLFKRCPKDQVKHLKAMHNKHREYLKRVEKLPPRLPEIKWEDYKDNVREEDLCIVCEFEDRYRSLDASIPFPLDPYSEKIDCMKKEYKNEVHYFNKASEAAIQVIEKEKKRIADMVDFEDMTLEEFRDNWPDKAIDPIKKPTFWPHTPEDQGLHPPETNPKLKKQKPKK